MKKILSIMLCVLMAVSLFAGCTKKTDTKSKTNDDPQSDLSNLASDPSGQTRNSGFSDVTGETGNAGGTGENGNVGGSQGGNGGGASTTKKPGGNAGTTPSKDKKPITDPLAVNLGGRTITIASAGEADAFNTKRGKSKYMDAVADRTAKLQSKLNCKIKFKTEKNTDSLLDAAFNTIMSGEKYADIIQVQMHRIPGYMSSELLADINTINTIDVNQKYMNTANIINSTKIGKKNFIVALKEMLVDTSIGVYFNKKLLKNNENPYNLVNKNQWTISKMRQMMKDATGTNPTPTTGQWGAVAIGYSWEASDAILAATGAELLKNNNGAVSYNVDSSEVIDAVNLANQMYVKDKTTLINQTNKDCIKTFMDNRALFLISSTLDAAEISNMDEDFGFVPFPRGDKAKNITSTVNWNSQVLGIFSNISNQAKEDAGALLQALAFEAEKTNKVKYDEYSTRYYIDDESAKMLEKVTETLKIPTHSLLCSADEKSGNWTVAEGTVRIVFDGVAGIQNPATLAAKTKSATVAELKSWMKKLGGK